MNNIGELLSEIEENNIALKVGTEFYYADRYLRKPVKCVIQNIEFGYPTTIFAKREDTNEVFRCYEGFGCYSLDNYDEAHADAQIQADRVVY